MENKVIPGCCRCVDCLPFLSISIHARLVCICIIQEWVPVLASVLIWQSASLQHNPLSLYTRVHDPSVEPTVILQIFGALKFR